MVMVKKMTKDGVHHMMGDLIGRPRPRLKLYKGHASGSKTH
jgi:hypothetical protein